VCTFYLELFTCTHSFYRQSTPYPPFNATKNSISSSLLLPYSHTVPAPQIRSRDFWHYINLCVCVCMCVYHRHRIDKYLDTASNCNCSRSCPHLSFQTVSVARWQTARVIISLFLPDQSQRSSFAVIGYAEACRR